MQRDAKGSKLDVGQLQVSLSLLTLENPIVRAGKEISSRVGFKAELMPDEEQSEGSQMSAECFDGIDRACESLPQRERV